MVAIELIPTGPFHGMSDNASALDAAKQIHIVQSLSSIMVCGTDCVGRYLLAAFIWVKISRTI